MLFHGVMISHRLDSKWLYCTYTVGCVTATVAVYNTKIL